jgi:LacI family transcriptional regulator
MVTQQDVARETGLSQTAVSLALRNSPDIPAATIRRVRAAAKRLGYRPDPLISALMAQRQRRGKGAFRAKIAFLSGFARRDEWRQSAYAAGCFDGARRAAADRGYVCEPFWLREPGISGSRLSTILWTQNVQGLLFAPLPVDYPALEIDWTKFAALSLDYSLARPVLNRVVDDHAFGIERVLDEVARRGYRRPGLVLRSSQDVRTHHSRLGVFLVDRRAVGATGRRLLAADPPGGPLGRAACSPLWLRKRAARRDPDRGSSSLPAAVQRRWAGGCRATSGSRSSTRSSRRAR